jgi:hypothetical protein
MTAAARRTPWSALVVASTGAGLLAVGLADAASRRGVPMVGLGLFWVGMLAMFGPSTWRLLGRTRWLVGSSGREAVRAVELDEPGGRFGRHQRRRLATLGESAPTLGESAPMVGVPGPAGRWGIARLATRPALVPALASGSALELALPASASVSAGHRHGHQAGTPPRASLLRLGPSVSERIGLVAVLGLALYLVKVMVSPAAITLPDEFSHLRTLEDILRTTHLFADNPLLQISAIYPGLEAGAATMVVTSGVGTFPVALLLIGAARLVAILAIFLLARRITHSATAAGVAAIIYMANPSFLAFDVAFAYESLALPLALVAIWATLRWADHHGRSPLDAVVAISAIAATAVTHHLTSVVLMAFLVVWALIALVRDRGRATIWPIWVAAVVAVASAGLWLLVAGTLAVTYLSTIIGGGVSELLQILSGLGEARRLFASHAGFVSPLPEIVTAYLAVGLLVLALPFVLVHALRGRRPSAIVLALALGALCYPASLALRFTSTGAETSQRASEFVFLALAILGADWLVGLRSTRLRPPRAIAFVGLLIVVGGGIVTGNPPIGRLPGPYHVGAEQRSIEPEGVAAASWALVELGPDNQIVADRTNAKLMGSVGLQYPVTSANSHLGTAWAMYAVTLDQTNLDVLRLGHIRYLVVDLRLTEDIPEYPYVFEQSEPDAGNHTAPMPLAAVRKWESLQGVTRIYDSGDIIIYDIGGLTDAGS